MGLHVKDNYDSLLVVVFKSEFLYLLNKRHEAVTGRPLCLRFTLGIEIKIKKEIWGGAGVRKVSFRAGPPGTVESTATSGKQLTVFVPPGLPKDSRK